MLRLTKDNTCSDKQGGNFIKGHYNGVLLYMYLIVHLKTKYIPEFQSLYLLEFLESSFLFEYRSLIRDI